MRLKRLEIQGFKSFPEKTVFKFQQDGLTVIVGPNGCGKSNIVDAVRWALGEQSAKLLRGQMMEDVIFNGSDRRKPAGLAEVSLIFENDGSIQNQWREYSEISVSRKLFRTGESEYLINGVSCRLRDIRELIADAGGSSRGYSIVEQGRISLLINSKPEEKRALIEEAAGVLKYRMRRLEAERKLERTRQNLLRVSDVIGEVRRQLNSMKRSAAKARRYRLLREELETTVLRLRFEEHSLIVSQLKELEDTLEGKRSVIDDMTSQLASAESREESIRVELTMGEEEITEAFESVRATEAEIARLEGDISVREGAIRSLEERLERLAEDKEELERRTASDHSQLQQLELELATIEEEHQQSLHELQDLQEKYSLSEKKLNQARGAMEESRNSLFALGTERSRLEMEVASSRRSRESLSRRRQDSVQRLEAVQERVTEGEGVLAERRIQLETATAESEDSAGRLSALRGESLQVRSAISNTESELATLSERQAELRGLIRTLNALEEQMEGLPEGVRSVLKSHGESRKAGVIGVVADYLEVPQVYEKAVMAVLGERLGHVIVDEPESGRSAVDYLKERAVGRGSFIPKTPRSNGHRDDNGSLKRAKGKGIHGPLADLVGFSAQLNGVGDFLLGGTLLVEDLDLAVRLWKENGLTATLVTLDGDVVEPTGVITGGNQDTEETLLARKRKIREVSKELGQVEARFEKTRSQRETLKEKADGLEAELAELEVTGRDKEKVRFALESSVSLADRELGQLRSSADDLQSEMALMDLEDEELSRTIQGCQERLSEVDRDEASSRTQIQDLERTMAALGSEVEERRSELEQARMRINSVSLRRESSQRALETAESRRREIDERRDRVSLELEDAAARIGMHTREISSGREAVRDAAQLLEDRKAGLQSLRRKQDELRQDAETLSSKARELRSAIGSLRDEASITDIRIHELRTQMQNIAQRVSEEHGRDISQLDAEPAERGPFDREEAAERIASIRDKIQRLGEVNPGAVEEFEELNQRFEFLSSQKNDLEASMESLQKAIRKINRTSKERFLETFQEVNRNFSTMFPRLFDGGDAQMFLMDENDPLNTGVDIQVRLPGKRLKSMQLLSGGEKAMVSLTMILSIFLAKPSPVCILDEVDAPLDENNLDNFAGIVRELSERYQFMLITHNKLTMEAADVLYGITMREPGVSQVVSVRLKDVA